MAYTDQFSFLGNDRNKCLFEAFLMNCLKAAGYTVHQAADDADTLVVKVALDFAAANQTGVIANDTDILVMLVAHYGPDLSEILMHTPACPCINSIRAISTSLDTSIVRRLQVVHANSGCDTTSSLFVMRRCTCSVNSRSAKY